MPKPEEILLSGHAVQTLVLPKVKFFMQPYIPEKAIVLVHGRFGTFKTPVMTYIAKAIAMGEPEVLGCPIKKAKVLFIQADTPKEVILERLQALNVAVDGLDFDFLYPGFDVVNPNNDEQDRYLYDLVRKQHREQGYEIVFIDSLRMIHNLDDKESQSPSVVYRALKRLFPGATIVLIHHDTKFNKDKATNETFSGSQAWMNHATVGIKFSLRDKKLEEVTLEHNKSQASKEEPPLHLKVLGGVHVSSLTEAKANEVEDFLYSFKDRLENLSTRELDAEIADHFAISERTARKRRLEISGGWWLNKEE